MLIIFNQLSTQNFHLNPIPVPYNSNPEKAKL